MAVGRRWRGSVMAMACGLAGGGLASCGGSSAAPHPGAHVDASVDDKLVINELMALNVLTAKDENGAASAWIELYNPTGGAIDLSGYALTDDFNTPAKAVLPQGVSIDAHGMLMLWADQNPAAGPTHVNVFLPAAGGSLGFARPDGTFIDRLSYGAQEVDLSAAREPDGSNNWVIEWAVSPGMSNPMGSGQPFGPQAASDPAEMVPAAGDLSDRVLGYDQLPQFDLKIADSDITSLKASPQTWVPATLTFGGRDYGPIGVNLKGTSSFQPIDQKPAFRVNINKFVKGARFFGLKEFLLNNMVQDPSMIHERLAYWIGRQAGGIPTPRCNHSWVTMNGTPLGLYATVEEAKDQMMAYSFTDSSGGVFTINYADFSTQYLGNFQYQDGTDDTTLITNTADALTQDPASAASAAAGQFVNLQEFTRYWALMVLTGHWGGWPYAPDPEPVGANVRIYADPTSKQLYFIPQGINDAFGTSDFDFIAQLKSRLAKDCARTPSCFQQLSSQLMELQGKAQQVGWDAEAQRVAAQVAPYVSMDSKKPYSDADVAMYQQQVVYFMTSRGTYVTQYLVTPASTSTASTP
ncbi:MAG TPA: CotH kinase family protein [Polyangia bacterium]|nr:CotH kinase family protein [Polyangia bacterium]